MSGTSDDESPSASVRAGLQGPSHLESTMRDLLSAVSYTNENTPVIFVVHGHPVPGPPGLPGIPGKIETILSPPLPRGKVLCENCGTAT